MAGLTTPYDEWRELVEQAGDQWMMDRLRKSAKGGLAAGRFRAAAATRETLEGAWLLIGSDALRDSLLRIDQLVEELNLPEGLLYGVWRDRVKSEGLGRRGWWTR